jgi:hypothetical protein
MRAVLLVVGLAIGLTQLLSATTTENLLWKERIQESNEAGKTWEESHYASERSLTGTESKLSHLQEAH